MAARIRKDDIVEVIAGDHKGARGKVLRIDRERERLIVEGVNMVHRTCVATGAIRRVDGCRRKLPFICRT